MTTATETINYLRPNGFGGYIIRQSDLSSWQRCQLQKFYDDRAKADPTAPQPEVLSATVYGTVMHYALMVWERAHHEGDPEALAKALATFRYYWRPDHLLELPGTQQITEWLPAGRNGRQSYGGLLERGTASLTMYAQKMGKEDSRLLALEYTFAVPLEIRGVTHTLTGTIDRLSLRKFYTLPYLSLDDYKTGKQPRGLRWNMQGTAYAWASTQPEFWLGGEHQSAGVQALDPFGDEVTQQLSAYFQSFGYCLMEDNAGGDLRIASRRFRWINIAEMSFGDGGWRSARDYSRLSMAVDAYVRACEAGIYAVSTSGEVCQFCSHGPYCAGTGLPDEDEGAP